MTMDPKLRGTLDRMIKRLEMDGHMDGFTDLEVEIILDQVYKHLRPLPPLIDMTAPLVIFGDIHGQFTDLKRLLELVGKPPKTRILCLGDYVDRGRNSLEVTMLLLCYMLRYPTEVTLLRGNHECAKMNRGYGFYEECRRKRSIPLWKKFQQCFNELPLSALVNQRILTMHGGISPDIKGWESLRNLRKPRSNIECDSGIPLDLMWADPSQDTCTNGWQYNRVRNASWMFGSDVISDFCNMLKIDLIVRAHEVTPDGHAFAGNKKQLCTVFSAPNYCGVDGNSGSVMVVSDKLEVSFVTLEPKLDAKMLTEEKKVELAKQNATDVKSPMPGGPKSPPQIADPKSGPETPTPTTDSSPSIASLTQKSTTIGATQTSGPIGSQTSSTKSDLSTLGSLTSLGSSLLSSASSKK